MPDLPELMVDNLCISFNRHPEDNPDYRLALLPQGKIVSAVGSSSGNGWIMAEAELGGQTVTGYVERRFLTAPEEFEHWLPPQEGITEVHMATGHPGARRGKGAYRPFPISESDAPTRDVQGNPEERAAQLTRILKWLDVENSARYQPGRHTYCNVYVYDFCYLARAYLPRVWWTGLAIARLERGERVPVRYPDTVTEQQANALFVWLNDHGPDFGWERVFNPDEAQMQVNQGSIGVICARHHDNGSNGHMSVIVPETDSYRAERHEDGTVRWLLHSEAGRNVRQYTTNAYWLNDSDYQEFGFWLHP